MANKEFTLENGLAIQVYKRRGSKNLRLSLTSTGQIRVTIPAWAPYVAGLEFAKSRHAWIEEQRAVPKILVDGQPIGKAHRLKIEPSHVLEKISSRVSPGLVKISYPLQKYEASDPAVQAAAKKAAIKAMRQQAEKLLPQRTSSLAARHRFKFQDVSIKHLKGRWGSCDSHSNIVFNLFLMQLPWDLIDYVILHELTHTKILKHGPAFWAAMAEILPEAKSQKKRLQEYHPVLDSPL